MPVGLRHNARSMDYRSMNGVIVNVPSAKPMDFDGIMTQHSTGRVLFIENKQPGEFGEMSIGQKITLDDVQNLSEKVTVLIVEHSGKVTENDAWEFDPVRIMSWKEKKWIDCDISLFRALTSEWWYS